MNKLVEEIKNKKWFVVAGIVLSAIAYYYDMPL